MFQWIHTHLQRHPLVRQAIFWSVPALLLGGVLRLLFLSYMPYAYWGSDSSSYFSFAYQLLSRGDISLDEKRRYVYPLLMLPLSLLPGAPLRWLAWLQHGLGLVTLIPLAYIVRRSLVHWKLWVIPVTALYASMPILLWYEHELLGEAFFFAALLWAFAGWVAWLKAERLERARQLFWWFFVPLALFFLTKPAGRFVWPGVLLGLVFVAAWRRLTKAQIVALAALLLITPTVGSKKQGAWLLYVAAFPLTQPDTPLHAAYKKEIRDLVEPLRQSIDAYYGLDDHPFAFLEKTTREPNRPLWVALEKKPKQKAQLYMDLALEGIRAEPLLFLYMGAQRVIASSNLGEFKEKRFTSGSYPERLANDYQEAVDDPRNTVRLAFALPWDVPLPPYSEFQKRLAPHPDSWMERTFLAWVRAYENASDLVRMPEKGPKHQRAIGLAKITPLGAWLLAGLILAVLLPTYRTTLGVWAVIAFGYLAGVFLVSQVNPRYFAPAWAVLVPLLAVPADAAAHLITRTLRRSQP
jgi:4-amino-4-deoxy-L-arabinose transferase-like glycosyltransferase